MTSQQTDVRLADIEMDVSIQCRASIDTATVNEYAERMSDGDAFPPIDLFGKTRWWIGDGWHRVLAAKQIGALTIPATLREGARAEALRHALGANAAHGHRRTNADKRRCVEIALREFPKMSSNAIARICAVGDDMVLSLRRLLPENGNTTVTTSNGKQYPVRRGPAPLKPEKLPARVRVKQITDLAAAGHNVLQIAETLGIGRNHVVNLISDHDIPITAYARPNHGSKAGSISAERVYEETVNALTGLAQGLNVVRNKRAALTQEAAKSLHDDARASLVPINAMLRKLREIASG